MVLILLLDSNLDTNVKLYASSADKPCMPSLKITQPARNFGLVASRISKLLIHVAEANGVPQRVMRSEVGLVAKMNELMSPNGTIRWKDLVTLGDRVGTHFHDDDALVAMGRSYYQHLEHLPYVRTASAILTLKGAFYFADRFTTPHNYEALICTTRWLNHSEAIKISRIKYDGDPMSHPIAHIGKGILEYFPTLFGRDPLPFVEMELDERESRLHIKLPPPLRPWFFIKRIVQTFLPDHRRWQALRDQEELLRESQWNASRRQKMLDELLTHTAQPIVLLEAGQVVFINQATVGLIGTEQDARDLPYQEIATKMNAATGQARVKFSYTMVNGTVIPLEARLSARLSADAVGKETLLLHLRDRREPETQEEALSLAREQARQALARDLHDGLGQTLSGLSYRAAALCMTHPENADLTALDRGIRSALAQSRNLAHRAHTNLDTDSVERLRLTCVSYAALADIPIHFSVRGDAVELNAERADEFEFILREALANAVRHSGASELVVSLDFSPTAIALEISDNGVGITAGTLDGFGIVSMKTRARALSASIEWIRPEIGTIVRCVLPILPS
jgi:signal transduction histidine kinase